MSRDLDIIKIVDEILELRKQDTIKTDSEIIGKFIEETNYLKKENLQIIKYADMALKMRRENKNLSKKQIIQAILETSRKL